MLSMTHRNDASDSSAVPFTERPTDLTDQPATPLEGQPASAPAEPPTGLDGQDTSPPEPRDAAQDRSSRAARDQSSDGAEDQAPDMAQGCSSAVAQGHPALQDHPSDPDQPQPPVPAAETDLSGPSPVRHPPAPEPDVVIPAQRTGGDSLASPPQNPRVPAQRRSPENDPSHQWDEPVPFAASNVAPFAFLPEADSPEKEPKGLPQRHAISLKSIADLADSLPYLLGYVPGNSVVLLALHGARGRLGRRTAVRIPDDPAQWPQIAERAATMLMSSAGDAPDGGAAAFLRKRRGGSLPDGVIAFLFQEPEEARPGAVPPPGAAELRERLRPLAQDIRVACGRFDVPVVEALCVSTGRSWSYVTPLEEQEPAGSALLPAGSSVLAATSVYEGMPIPLPAAVLESRLLPWCTAAARAQERVLDLVALDLLPQILSSRENVLKIRRGTIGLLDNVLTRFATAPVPSDPLEADLADDEALTHEEAARLVIGLQDREARDEAASFLAFPDAARRLWRALARRCVRSYKEHAAAPLSLVGWTAWALGDESEARLALHLALAVDPHYVFAALLDQAFDKGVEPDEIRQQLRGRAGRPAARRSAAGPAAACDSARAAGTGSATESEPEARASQSVEGTPEGGRGGETTERRAVGGRRRTGSGARKGSAARTDSAARPATRRRDAGRPGGVAPGGSGGKAMKRREGGAKESYARARRRLAVSPPGCEGARSPERANSPERENLPEREQGRERDQRGRGVGMPGASDRRAAVDRSPLTGRECPDPEPSDASLRALEEGQEADAAKPMDRIESPVTSGGPSSEVPGRDASAQDTDAGGSEGPGPSMEQGRKGAPVPGSGGKSRKKAMGSGSGRERPENARAGSERPSQKTPGSGPGHGGHDAPLTGTELGDRSAPTGRAESGPAVTLTDAQPGGDRRSANGAE
ncbi:DUF4192 family protein [Streptomyces sp. SID4926]|nr:DUF4192 family protein [Streptomyces sp. SID4926]